MRKGALIFLPLFMNCAMEQPVNWDTTLTIHKIPVTIKTKQLKDNKVLLVTQSKLKNTIIDTLEADGLLNLELTDLNNDHYSDIMATYIGNNPTYFLYLFEPSEEKFIRLEGYDKFPDAVQLKAYPLFYYSYHRAGCADFNWMSDLFKIEKFKVVQIGQIYGQGCATDLKLYPQKIDIYKIFYNTEKEKVLLQTIPYSNAIGADKDKWEFIEKYWNKNF